MNFDFEGIMPPPTIPPARDWKRYATQRTPQEDRVVNVRVSFGKLERSVDRIISLDDSARNYLAALMSVIVEELLRATGSVMRNDVLETVFPQSKRSIDKRKYTPMYIQLVGEETPSTQYINRVASIVAQDLVSMGATDAEPSTRVTRINIQRGIEHRTEDYFPDLIGLMAQLPINIPSRRMLKKPSGLRVDTGRQDDVSTTRIDQDDLDEILTFTPTPTTDEGEQSTTVFSTSEQQNTIEQPLPRKYLRKSQKPKKKSPKPPRRTKKNSPHAKKRSCKKT
jgi:hypothetical protein